MALRNPKLHFLDLLCYFKLGNNTSIQNVEISEDLNIGGSLSKRHLARTPDLYNIISLIMANGFRLLFLCLSFRVDPFFDTSQKEVFCYK